SNLKNNKLGVEQPFCIIELNQPRQTHQTSIAKNGLNPYVYHWTIFIKIIALFL
ncbi:unnamed protein product, partial [Rotaria sp. Silwood1]